MFYLLLEYETLCPVIILFPAQIPLLALPGEETPIPCELDRAKDLKVETTSPNITPIKLFKFNFCKYNFIILNSLKVI